MQKDLRLHGEAARLCEYFRYLRVLLQNGILRVSSSEMSEVLGIAPSQVRLDLTQFKDCGRKGYGYLVKDLYKEISRKLGAGDGITAFIIGPCLCLSQIKESAKGRGIDVIGQLDSFDGKFFPYDIAVITDEVNPQAVAEKVVECGAKAVWNMTQKNVNVAVPTANLPIGDILMMLCYEIKNNERTDGK